MPYKIEKVPGGFKVSDGQKFFSNKPLTKEKATAQRWAMAIPLGKKRGKPAKYFFTKS